MAATKPSGATGPLKRVEALLTLLPTVRKELDLPSDDVIIRASGGKELDILVTLLKGGTDNNETIDVHAVDYQTLLR